jgi:hypothetical protein
VATALASSLHPMPGTATPHHHLQCCPASSGGQGGHPHPLTRASIPPPAPPSRPGSATAIHATSQTFAGPSGRSGVPCRAHPEPARGRQVCTWPTRIDRLVLPDTWVHRQDHNEPDHNELRRCLLTWPLPTKEHGSRARDRGHWLTLPPPISLPRRCVNRVRGCEVYVGVLGTRYGSAVPLPPSRRRETQHTRWPGRRQVSRAPTPPKLTRVSRQYASGLISRHPCPAATWLRTTRCEIFGPARLAFDELAPGRAAVAYRPAQRDLAGGTAEGEVPLREQRRYLRGIDATRAWPAVARAEREY